MYHLFHLESKDQPLAPRHSFALRLLRNALWSLAIIIIWLIIGMAGYGGLEGMSAVDAFVNAAMILSGMGPVQALNTAGGKIFAGLYAIISGIVIFGIAGFDDSDVLERVIRMRRELVRVQPRAPQLAPAWHLVQRRAVVGVLDRQPPAVVAQGECEARPALPVVAAHDRHLGHVAEGEGAPVLAIHSCTLSSIAEGDAPPAS